MRTVSRRRFLEGSATGLAVAGLGGSSLCAQDWARQAVDKSPRRREWVSVKHGGRSVESVVAYPQSFQSGTAPAIIVIHEIFGMSDWVEKVADEFAEAGFLAIAPDLLSGMGPNGGRTKDLAADQVGPTINKLPPDQITADLNACADYVKGLTACNGKVCVVGFSWGGGQSFRFATNRKDLSAACVFYGNGPAADAIPAIPCPVYGFFAGTDTRVNPTVPPTQEQMKAAGKSFEVVTYEGAAHGFMRAGEQPDATEPNQKARAAAWVKLKELQNKYR
jgi:carboxymethylenebutenolidase